MTNQLSIVSSSVVDILRRKHEVITLLEDKETQALDHRVLGETSLVTKNVTLKSGIRERHIAVARQVGLNEYREIVYIPLAELQDSDHVIFKLGRTVRKVSSMEHAGVGHDRILETKVAVFYGVYGKASRGQIDAKIAFYSPMYRDGNRTLDIVPQPVVTDNRGGSIVDYDFNYGGQDNLARCIKKFHVDILNNYLLSDNVSYTPMAERMVSEESKLRKAFKLPAPSANIIGTVESTATKVDTNPQFVGNVTLRKKQYRVETPYDKYDETASLVISLNNGEITQVVFKNAVDKLGATLTPQS